VATDAVSPVRSLFDRLFAEGLVTVVAAARKNGVKLHNKSALRQAMVGSGGATLESVKLNGRRLTSVAAYRRFLEAQQRLSPKQVDRGLAAYGLGRDQQRVAHPRRSRKSSRRHA